MHKRPKSRDKRLLSHKEYKCTGKRAFESERVALMAADASRARSGLDIYTYKCQLCKDWHLTRSAPRPVRAGPVDQYAQRMALAEAQRLAREQKREQTNADIVGS